MQRYFNFAAHGTTYRQETLAGVTTFLTMAYIIVVNPAILEAAGIPKGPSMTATIISAAFGTLVMGLYAKRPFAIAPYMGENAFIGLNEVGIVTLGVPGAPVSLGKLSSLPALLAPAGLSLLFYVSYPYSYQKPLP